MHIKEAPIIANWTLTNNQIQLSNSCDKWFACSIYIKWDKYPWQVELEEYFKGKSIFMVEYSLLVKNEQYDWPFDFLVNWFRFPLVC